MRRIVLSAFLLVFTNTVLSQVIVDTSFRYAVKNPAFKANGPVVLVDRSHNNYHTAFARYLPFTRVLEADGYVVRELNKLISKEQLNEADVLVLANGLHRSNFGGNWRLPTPSAYTDSEIRELVSWVREGGNLFLIADHMPFAGAASQLASEFGFEFCNCFALDNRQRSSELFSLSNRSLLPSEITKVDSSIDSIITFTGSAFKIQNSIVPVLALENYTLLSPDQAWVFNDNTPFVSSDGYYQLAYRKFGKGKIVVSGEAAMFTAQLADGEPTGMNHPQAKDNARLLLAILHWLTL